MFNNRVYYLRLFFPLKTIQTVCLLLYFVILQIMLQMTSKSPRVRPHIMMKLLQIIFDQSWAWLPAGGFWCRTASLHQNFHRLLRANSEFQQRPYHVMLSGNVWMVIKKLRLFTSVPERWYRRRVLSSCSRIPERVWHWWNRIWLAIEKGHLWSP